jgi:hypothetical protein
MARSKRRIARFGGVISKGAVSSRRARLAARIRSVYTPQLESAAQAKKRYNIK